MSIKKGIESLKEAVVRDCQNGSDCFNPKGCDKPDNNCFHNYCNTFAWTVERAKHYAAHSGSTYQEVLAQWESKRSYWYMNYYQDCNQPLLESGKTIKHEDWVKEGRSRFGWNSKKWKFVCPSCGNVQTPAEFKKLKVDGDLAHSNCIGRYDTTKGCDWSLGGFLKIHKQSVIIDNQAVPVFEFWGEK